MSARSSDLPFFAALAGLCTLAFAPGLTSDLIHYDDGIYIGGNPLMMATGWDNFPALWDSARVWRGEFVEFFPLRDTVYWLISRFFGTAGTPYHVASLLFHIAASVLVFKLISKLDASRWVARVTALLFALHPIHVESVTWAASLKDPMYTALLLGSLVAYLKYREGLKPLNYALSLGLLIGALMVKSMALVAPLLLLGIERLRAEPTPWRLVVARLAGPSLISGIFTAQFIGIGVATKIVGQPHGGTWTSHWVLTAWAQARYLMQSYVPQTFELIECFEPAKSYADPRFIAGLGALVLALVLAFVWRRQPLRVFFISWHFICLLPVSNLVPFPAVMADRYLYAASVAACWLLASLLDANRLRLTNGLAAAIVVTFGLTTAYRTSLWQHEDELWSAVDEDPTCLIDPEFPAAQTHLIRSWTATTPEVKLQAIERGLASPAYNLPASAEPRCDLLVPGIPIALNFHQNDKALEWARQAIRGCPKRAEAWNAAMLTTLHRAPELAHTAAERAAKLKPAPFFLLLEVLTSLEVRFEASRAEEVTDIVSKSPTETCPALGTWRREVSPQLAASVAPAAAFCPR